MATRICKLSPAASQRRKIWQVWDGMRRRCTPGGHDKSAFYAGRGIAVCLEWQAFEPFMEWAVAAGWHVGLQIDRMDNDGPYSPENCRFVTCAENARNRRSNRMITISGRTQCLADWAADVGIGDTTVLARLGRGWSIEAALAKPVRFNRRYHG